MFYSICSSYTHYRSISISVSTSRCHVTAMSQLKMSVIKWQSGLSATGLTGVQYHPTGRHFIKSCHTAQQLAQLTIAPVTSSHNSHVTRHLPVSATVALLAYCLSISASRLVLSQDARRRAKPLSQDASRHIARARLWTHFFTINYRFTRV